MIASSIIITNNKQRYRRNLIVNANLTDERVRFHS